MCIRDRSQADPVHKETYKKNAASYKKQLQSLYQEYQPRFEKIDHKDFVAGHAAFGYLCRDFGLHMDSICLLYTSTIFKEVNGGE